MTYRVYITKEVPVAATLRHRYFLKNRSNPAGVSTASDLHPHDLCFGMQTDPVSLRI